MEERNLMALFDLLSKVSKIPASTSGINGGNSNRQPLPLEAGLEHLRAHRFESAITSLRAALRREPGRFVAVRGLATAYLLAGKSKQARKVLEKFTGEYAMSGEGWRLAAQLEWKLNDRQRAVEILQAGLKRLPKSQILHKQLAMFLALKGDFKQTADHARQAAAASIGADQPAVPASPAATIAQSDQDWLDQIAADPVLLGAILSPIDSETAPISRETWKMLEEIERKLAQLLESQPHHADRQLLLAKLQARLEDVPSAMASLQRALKSSPNLVEAHRLMANLHGRIGHPEQAIQTLKALLKRGLSWPDIHFEIAAFERELGRGAEARSHLYSAIRLNPKFEQAKQMLDRMAA